eukprot:5480489-Pyramimonas_sp.AAC.1
MPTMASSSCSLLHVVVGVDRACSRRSLIDRVWVMWSPWASLQMLLNVVRLRFVRSIVEVAVTVPSIISSSCRML